MDSTIEAFEKDLISKLEYKASSRMGIDNVLLKIFKFFDLESSGLLRKSDFLKAIAKAGVVLSDPEVSDFLFKLYSHDQPTINYKEFVAQITGEGQQNDPNQLTKYQGQYQEKVTHLNSQGFQQAQTNTVTDPKGTGFQEQAKFSLDLLKNKLALRGSLGLLSFAKALRSISQTSIQSQQFFQVFRDQRIDMDNNAQIIIFMQADKSQQGYATFEDLMQIIKGFLPIYRQTMIRQVFDSFGAQEVPANYLIDKYNAERHPDIRHHNKRPEEIREEFAAALDIYQNLTKRTYLDINSFIEFYHYFGFHINNDELFRSITVSVWDLDQGSPIRNVASKAHMQTQQQNLTPQPNQNSQKNYDQQDMRSQTSKAQSQVYNQNNPPQQQYEQRQQLPNDHDQQSQAKGGQIQQSQHSSPQSKAPSQSNQSQTSVNQQRQVELIVQRIKNRLATRGAKGFISMYRAFKQLDMDKDGFLSITEYRKAIRDHRIDVTDSEIDLVFSYFDRERTGLIDLWGMLFVLKGEMSPQRNNLVEQVWEKIDRNNQGLVTLQDVQSAFQSRNHPDVKSSKRQDDDVQQDFNDSFLMLHHINGGFGHEEVSKDEFFEYFSNFSAAISEDKYFETILQLTFKLNTETPIQNNYAGGSKRVFEPDHKKGYLQDHHRYVVSGGSVAANAPFGTFAEPDQSVKSRPQSAYQQSASFNIFKPIQGQEKGKAQSYEQDQGYGQKDQGYGQKIQEVRENIPKKNEPVQQQVHNNGKHGGSFQSFKSKVLGRGLRCLISLQKKLKNHDRSSLGTVSLQEFQRVTNDLRLQVGEQDIQEVFKQFEVQESGVMNYDGLVKALQGTMSQRKFNALMGAFESFSKQNQQANFDEIRDCYNPRNDPDVKQNKKREDDVLSEFLDTFEENHKLFTGEEYFKNPYVSFEEFINYHNNISALMEDDLKFENYVTGVWPSKGRRY